MTTTPNEQPKHDNTTTHESTVQQRLRTVEQLADQLRATAEPPATQPIIYTPAPKPDSTPPTPAQRVSTVPIRSLDPPAMPSSPDAGLEFDITADDLYAYNLYCIRHVPAIRRTSRRVGILLLIIALATLATQLLPGPITIALRLVLLWVGLTVLLLAIGQLFFPGFLIRKQIEKGIQRDVYKHTLGRQLLSISSEGYAVAVEGLETRRSWALTSDVVTDDRYLYLFVSPRCANIIPRRACATDQQWNDLRERIMGYYHAATSGQKASA
jgi:hypothetical protein